MTTRAITRGLAGFIASTICFAALAFAADETVGSIIGGGYGVRFPLERFPLSVDSWPARHAYKLTLKPRAQHLEGSRQSPVVLGSKREGDLGFVIRTVNIGEEVRGQIASPIFP